MQDVGKDVRSSEFVVRFCEYRNLSFFFFMMMMMMTLFNCDIFLLNVQNSAREDTRKCHSIALML